MKYEFVSRLMRPCYIMVTRKNQKDDGEFSTGKRLKFENHKFSTDNEEEAEFLRSHKDFGGKNDNRCTISEMGNTSIKFTEPPKPTVTSSPAELEKIQNQEKEDNRIKNLEDKVNKMSENLDLIVSALKKKKE